LPADALAPNLSFSAAVAATQAHLAPPELLFNNRRRRIHCGDKALTLPPQLHAWYLWLANRCQRQLPPVRYHDAKVTEFLEFYASIIGIDSIDYERTAKTLAMEGFSKEFFEQKCAKVNREIKAALGQAATPYLITPQGNRPLTRYGLMLQPEQIRLNIPP
jgi:hypothetical protein